MTTPILEMKNITKEFPGVKALNNDTLRYDGANLVTLLTHMSRNGLEFAPSLPGEEPAYQQLFHMMRDLYVAVGEDQVVRAVRHRLVRGAGVDDDPPGGPRADQRVQGGPDGRPGRAGPAAAGLPPVVAVALGGVGAPPAAAFSARAARRAARSSARRRRATR